LVFLQGFQNLVGIISLVTIIMKEDLQDFENLTGNEKEVAK